MKNWAFKFEPVAWMTTIVGVLGALMTLDETLEQTGTADLIPATWEPWVLGITAALTVLLGKVVRGRVTPLADPRSAEGYPLGPVPPVGDGVRNLF